MSLLVSAALAIHCALTDLVSAQEARLVADISPGTGSSFPLELARFGRRVIFAATDPAVGDEPRVSAGTPQTTSLLRDIVGGDSISAGFRQAGLQCYFRACDATTGCELWVTNGRGSTRRVADIRPGLANSNANPTGALGEVLFFTAVTDAFGAETWRTDGTALGTQMLVDSEPGVLDGGGGNGVELGGFYYFNAARVIYRTDGTPAGTRALQPAEALLTPGRLTRLGDRILFRVTGSRSPLWITDGSDAGTAPIMVGGSTSDLTSVRGRFAVLRDRAVFLAVSVSAGNSLWSTDGTAQGTRLIRAFAQGSGSDVIRAGPLGFFLASTTETGSELWRTDGTPEGTQMVADIVPGNASALVQRLTPSAGRLFFTAIDSSGLRQLWVTSGDPSSTRPVTMPAGARFTSFSGYSSADTLMVDVLGRLYFVADDAAHGTELWTIPPVCTADWNLDGALDADDLADFVAMYFGPGRPLELDFNDDGSINADDLADFITAYFTGC